MNRTTFLKITCGAAALGIGVIAGSYSSSREKGAVKSGETLPGIAEAVTSIPGFAALKAVPRTIDDSEFKNIAAATGAKRWLLFLSAAERATAADMAALIRCVGPDSTAIRMLGARWAKLDPVHMFVSIYADSFLPADSEGAFPNRSQLSTVLFEEWAKTDLAAAVKALTDVPDSATRETYRAALVRGTLKDDVEQGLRLMKQWQIRGSIPDMKKVTEWAARDPQHAAKTLLELGNDYSAQQALRAVGAAWAPNDLQGGLVFAAQLDSAARANLGNQLMQRWAQTDPRAAATFATSQTDMSYRAILGQGLVSTWALSDPKSALAWSQENLRGEARTESVAGVIGTIAQSNLSAASEIVANMEPGGIQNRACAAIFETWLNRGPGERNAAFEWLTSLPDQETQQMALSRVQWNRAFPDPESMREFLMGPYGKLAPDYLMSQLGSMQAANDPDGAMKWASTLPASRASMARMGVLSSWMSRRPEDAQAYVLAMPAGSERQEAVRIVTQYAARQSPELAADWLKALPTGDQQIANEVFQQVQTRGEFRRPVEYSLSR